MSIYEEVVIPLDRLTEYHQGIAEINREQATKNDQAILAAIKSYIETLDIAETKCQLPSLRLLAQEALILEATDLGELNQEIKDCLRCGKCKPVCTTHVPRANLLYSPRNKILATGLLIEAVLYEEQTRRGISLEHYAELNDVADHCTVCHRCVKPCPVNIDFGDVTVKMREILRAQGKNTSKLCQKTTTKNSTSQTNAQPTRLR